MRQGLIVSTRLLVLTLSAGLGACSTTGADTSGTVGERFAVQIGAPVAGIEEVMWAEGYGFEGQTACPAEARDVFGCKAGDEILRFQPLAMGRKGHVYLKIESGRIAQIGWDLRTVAFSDG